MKTIKIFLSAILMMMAIAVEAQSVWVYKSDGTKVAYDASLVKSVEYATLCSIEDVTLLEDYNIDEGKHTFAESLITSVGSTIPSGATMQFGVVNSSDKTEVPSSWGNANNAVASSDGIWQVWAKVTPSASNKGFKENVIRIGEVRISETDYGYYSFNATSTAEIKNLTASDFTKLTKATSEVDCGAEGGLACVLTEGTTAPNIYKFSAADNMYGNMGTMKQSDTAGRTKEINGKTYNVWYVTGATGGNISKCKIIIN